MTIPGLFFGFHLDPSFSSTPPPPSTISADHLPSPTPSPLLLPDLAPVTETASALLYNQATIFAPDGQPVTFWFLNDLSFLKNFPPISTSEISLPFTPDQAPYLVRGYFSGHLAWDISIPYDITSTPLLPPNPDALLLASFINVPLGQLAQRLEFSGSVNIFYLQIATSSDPLPYLVTYAHLTPDSIQATLNFSQTHLAKPISAGLVGHTGLTDGHHLHLQVIDLTYLYQLSNTHDPIKALAFLSDLNQPISSKELTQIFIDPHIIYSHQLVG